MDNEIDNEKVRLTYRDLFTTEGGKMILDDLRKYINSYRFDGNINNLAVNQGKRELLSYIENEIHMGEIYLTE